MPLEYKLHKPIREWKNRPIRDGNNWSGWYNFIGGFVKGLLFIVWAQMEDISLVIPRCPPYVTVPNQLIIILHPPQVVAGLRAHRETHTLEISH